MPIDDLISRKRLSDDLTRRILLLLESQSTGSKSAVETMAATITSTITLLIDVIIDERMKRLTVREDITLGEYRAKETGKETRTEGGPEGTNGRA